MVYSLILPRIRHKWLVDAKRRSEITGFDVSVGDRWDVGRCWDGVFDVHDADREARMNRCDPVH